MEVVRGVGHGLPLGDTYFTVPSKNTDMNIVGIHFEQR